MKKRVLIIGHLFLKNEGIDVNDENIFIAAACGDKGIEF